MSQDDLVLGEDGRLCLPSGSPYTGVTEDFYEDGRIASRYRFLNGLPHGLQQEWYETGQIALEEARCLGQFHGYRREWYPNGRLKYENLSEHGFRIHVKQFDENGNLIRETSYPYPDQSYSALVRWRAEARAQGFGPPEGVDPRLLPP